jgi:ribosomal protein S18 acetylase RimI-like enzyme
MNVENNNFPGLNGVAAEAAGVLHWPADECDSEPLQDTPPVRIRAYRETDRGAICRLCCETGFLGGPVDSLFRDRELFADLFTRPYLDHEPEWVFVAEAHKQVIGYVLGSVGPRFGLVLLRSGFWTTSRMLLRLAGGRYNDHPRSRRFIRWLLTAGFWEQPRHPRAAAHLHFQLHKNYRGRGIAWRLWEHYEREIRAIGMKQCYGAFYSHPGRRPELAYARYGFQVFDRRRTTLFEPEIREPVEVVCVRKIL